MNSRTLCRETFSFAAAFSPSVIAFLSPDFMGYRDSCKPKIGCFCASIGCFPDFLQTQSKSNLHNTIIKQTAKKSRREIEANRRKNCAAVNKEYEKTFTQTASGQRSSMQGGRSNGMPSDSEMYKSEKKNSTKIKIVLHGYFQKSRYNTNKNAVLHSPAENGGV